MSGSAAVSEAGPSRCVTVRIPGFRCRISAISPMKHIKSRSSPAVHIPRLAAGGLALALGLAACSKGPPPPPCPAVVPVADAAQMVRFNGDGHDLTDVVFEARIQGYALTCEYDDDVIDGQMTLSLLAVRGPSDQERIARVGYFVAV